MGKPKSVCVAVFVLARLICPGQVHAVDFVNAVSMWGEAADMTPDVVGVSAAVNRLGGFGSDIAYDPVAGVLYGVPDTGPGGGVLSHEARMQKFSLDVDPVTGQLSNFALLETIRFKTSDGSEVFNGQIPSLLTGSPLNLGNSLDPEGLAIGPNGNFFVSDETGPSIYEFEPVTVGDRTEARLVRAFAVPDRWVPRDENGDVNYEARRNSTPALVSGRQGGRGIESLTLNPDGTTLFAMLQDPLLHEGGRTVRNVRMAQIDVDTGQLEAEYIYQLESLEGINSRLPEDAQFSGTQQGRNISTNAMIAVNDQEFLVLERDNRGVGVANPVNADPVRSQPGTKRVYRIDLTGATDVSGIDLPDTGELPPDVVPVTKSLLLDVRAELESEGLTVAEKLEGLALVPLSGPSPFALLVACDNDFSVLDTEDPVTGEILLFDVYTDGTDGPMDGPLMDRHLLPSYIYAFAVPEPSTILLLLLSVAATVPCAWRSRSRSPDVT
jgi:hypothetical protein